MKIKNILKKSVMLLICIVMLTGCINITPAPTDDSVSLITPDVTLTPKPRPTLGATTPTPVITPVRTPKPEATPSYTTQKFKGVIDISCEFVYTNITDLDSDHIAYFRKLLLDKFGLRITRTGMYKEGNDTDLVISGRNQNTGMLVSGTTAVASTVNDISDAHSMGERIGAINLMDYLDKMPNYTSKFHRKDIFISQLHEDSYMAFPYVVDGKMYTMPLIGGFEGSVDGVWVYNKTWFSENGYELPSDMEGLVNLLVTHRNTDGNTKSPLIFSSAPLQYSLGDIPSLATGVAAALGVDLDYLTSQNRIYDISDEADWQDMIIKMFTLNGDDIECTLNTENYLKALELIKKINDNNLAREVSFGHNFDDTCDNYAVAYIPLEYQTEKAGDVWSFDYNRYCFLARQNWVCVANQFCGEGNVYVNIREDIPQNINSSFYILENSNQEIIDRLIAFLDWCCTDEGIAALGFGEKGTHWKYEGDKVRIIQQNNLFSNIYKVQDIAGWRRKIAPTIFMNPISSGEAIRILADKVSVKDYHYQLSKNGPDMSSSGAYMDYKYKTTVGKNDVVYLESLDPTVFSMEVGKMGQYNEMYEYIIGIISIVSDFYSDFMSGEKTAKDFDDYVAELNKAGIDNVIQYIENVYDNAYAKYYIPSTLY